MYVLSGHSPDGSCVPRTSRMFRQQVRLDAYTRNTAVSVYVSVKTVSMQNMKPIINVML